MLPTSTDSTDGGGGASVVNVPEATPVEKSLLNDACIWYPVLARRLLISNVTEDEDDEAVLDVVVQPPEVPVR
ncbi:MAG: hypothetical protein F4Z31_06070 [Gemmatimonadetes bacterium]|nr:hypothetical protein [Gemmatimonadota bacterium]